MAPGRRGPWRAVPRTGIRQQYTIGGLTNGALYWARVRAAKTAFSGQTLYTTAWSPSEPAVAGDWAPQNLAVAPGDRRLTVTWGEVAAATGYEIEYRAAPDGPWVTYGRGPVAPRGRPVAGPPVLLLGLGNGSGYDEPTAAVA